MSGYADRIESVLDPDILEELRKQLGDDPAVNERFWYGATPQERWDWRQDCLSRKLRAQAIEGVLRQLELAGEVVR